MNKESARRNPLSPPKSRIRNMPSIARSKGKTNQYERILSVSESLMSQKGYKGVSFQQIADKIGLHKSSLFHYFGNKEELLLRILERPFNEFYADFQQIVRDKELRPDEKLKKAIDSHLSLLMDYEDNVSIYLNEMQNLSGKNRRMHLMKIREYEEDFQKIVEGMKKDFLKGWIRRLLRTESWG